MIGSVLASSVLVGIAIIAVIIKYRSHPKITPAAKQESVRNNSAQIIRILVYTVLNSSIHMLMQSEIQ